MALVYEFNTVHLSFDAASAVVSAPISPDCTAEIFRRPQRLVSCDLDSAGVPSLSPLISVLSIRRYNRLLEPLYGMLMELFWVLRVGGVRLLRHPRYLVEFAR